MSEWSGSNNVCARLHQILSALPTFPITRPPAGLPENGVYFLFENGEAGHGIERIVRVGSHNRDGNLATRLREHLTRNKDRSIFRQHIGHALLRRSNDPYTEIWQINFTTRKSRESKSHLRNESRQQEIEAAVSTYIEGAFHVRVLSAANAQSATNLEKLCIAAVSSCGTCQPSRSWLGLDARDRRIRESGLWQIQHLKGKQLSEDALNELAMDLGA